MATYSTLRGRVLSLTDQTGVTTTQTVAEIGLEEAMKYVATKVELPSLHKSATYTWGASDTYAELSADFGVSDFETPDVLYVNNIPYDFREYEEWLQLKESPTIDRRNLSTAATVDERPDRVWTMDSSDNIYVNPVSTDNTLLLRYLAAPAAYGDGTGTPELPSFFDGILVAGAQRVVQQYITDPEAPISFYQLFKALDPQIMELDLHLKSKRQHRKIRLARSYRTPRGY